VLAHPLRPQTFPVAQRIAESFTARGAMGHAFTTWDSAQVSESLASCDVVVAIGGDGAMLRAARVSAPFGVPVLGINMGQLGFLTEIDSPDVWPQALDRVLSGDFWIEQRMMISASLLRDGQTLCTEYALNDVVVSSSMFGKMVLLDTFIDGDWTTTYYADALVISTATGSTAYALATGGPILPPELKNILLVPSAPHLSMDRPIVLSEGATVRITPSDNNANEVIVMADGVQIGQLGCIDALHVQAADYISRFLRMRGRNYFYRSLLDRLEPRVRRRGLERHEG